MTNRKRILKQLAKLRELVEHVRTAPEEREAALLRIRQLKAKYHIGQYEEHEDIHRRPGPPSKPPEEKLSQVVKVLLTRSEKARVRSDAAKAGCSMSEWCRQLLTGPRPLQD